MLKMSGNVSRIFRKFIKNSFDGYVLQNHTCIAQTKTIIHTRFLYSKSSLGLDSFEQQRERTKMQLSNLEEKFKERMSEYTSDDNNMIFTEDLKNMIHLASTDQETDLVIAMLKRFNAQNEQLRFGSFKFGPVVMRLFHLLNKPKLAIECFNNEEFNGLFDQLITYQVYLDLLYENKMYNEVLENFKIIQNRQMEGAMFPRNSVVIVLAACYKLNNQDSLNYALELWKKLESTGYYPTRRAVTFCAALVLNQGKTENALEIISNVKNQNYTTVRNLKVLALAKLGRLEDVIPLLKSVLMFDRTNEGSHTFNRDVLEKIKEHITKEVNAELNAEFSRIEEMFAKQGHISDKTLDEQLCSEIQNPALLPSNRNDNNRFNQKQSNFYQRGNQFNTRITSRRPGLNDLV